MRYAIIHRRHTGLWKAGLTPLEAEISVVL